MPLKIDKFEQTPNPDALKCVLASRSPALPGAPAAASPTVAPSSLQDQPSNPSQSPATLGRPRSYRSPEEALNDPLARAIFAVPGIAGVLILQDFITITRTPGASWAPIKRAVEAALGAT